MFMFHTVLKGPWGPWPVFVITDNPWHEKRPEAIDFRRRIMGA